MKQEIAANMKKVLTDTLRKCNLLPETQGRIVINISADHTISSIEVTKTYR